MDKLSLYMSEAHGRPLPSDVAEQAKQHTLDTFAAMISGAELPPGEVALKFARSQAGGTVATVVASNIVCGPLEAAMANGMLAHSDETDDSHAPAHCHPGCGIVPAALAAGEQFGIGGAHFLRAVALGWDVGTRVTMNLGGVPWEKQTHRSTHSIANTFGAAAAAGCAARLSPRQMRWLLDYAAQQASGTLAWQRDSGHIQKSLVFAGFPARNGVSAALIIQLGGTGVDDIFTGADNFLLAEDSKGGAEGLIDQLGERYEVTRTNIKKWAVGSPIQAALDAVEILEKRHPFEASQVRSVVVRLGTSAAKTVNNREIPDINLQHLVAIMLIDKTVSFRAAHRRSVCPPRTRQDTTYPRRADGAQSAAPGSAGRDHAQRWHQAQRAGHGGARHRPESDDAPGGCRQGPRSDHPRARRGHLRGPHRASARHRGPEGHSRTSPAAATESMTSF
jgi:2-methylcitrate dehydratase PrpD